MLKRSYLFILVFTALLWCGNSIAQMGHVEIKDVGPSSGSVKPTFPFTEALWDIQFNYDANAVTGAAGNAGAIYIESLNEFWTSRWAANNLHRWTSAGTLIEQFTITSVTGVRSLTSDGTLIYAGVNTTTIQVIDPITRTRVGTITAPQSVRYLAYDPTADGGNGGLWLGNFTTNLQLVSLTGTVLTTHPYAGLGVTSIYGAAWDGYSAGGPYLWLWGQGAGSGTPQWIVQVNPATGMPTGVTHDVGTDIIDAAGIAGGLFIAEGLVPGFATLGGLWQGGPDRLFGYELAPVGPPVGPGPATNPNPVNGSTGVDVNADISWTNPAGATSIEVFWGTSPGSLVSVYSGVPVTIWDPGTMAYSTPYYWKVNETDGSGTTTGALWSFTTEADPSIVQAFFDDFEAGAGNWTITNDGGTCVWEVFFPPYPNVYTLPAPAGGGMFSADVDECGSGTTLLSTATVTNPIDATLYQTVWLEFDNDFLFLDPADACYVEVSTDGTNWTTVWSQIGASLRNTHEMVDLTAEVALSSFWIRLRSVQPFWDWWWTVDNVAIYNDNLVPVELTSFTANTTSGSVNLNWQTATETNNYGFEVERKATGQEFTKVGFVAGYGTTTETKNYSFVDNSVISGSYTYRLKQVDLDGRFEYSNEVEVDLAPTSYSLAQNYPNPFNPTTKIDFSLASDSKVTLKIFDVIGQEVITLFNGNLSAGVHSQNFDASSINSGVYFYTIEAVGVDGTNFSSTKKMMLTK